MDGWKKKTNKQIHSRKTKPKRLKARTEKPFAEQIIWTRKKNRERENERDRHELNMISVVCLHLIRNVCV